MNFRIKDFKQVVLHASGGSGAGFIDGVWHGQPQKKEWVGLTDEEVKYIADSEWEEAFVRLVEAKLKEKNS